jgi:hypothetical protein
LGKGQSGKFDPVGVIHQDIAVDKWKKTVDGCGNEAWEKDGTASFSFGVSDTTRQQFQKQTDWLGWKDFFAVGFGLPAGRYLKGEIYESTFDPKFVADTIDTTPEQDMEWLNYMEGRVKTTDRYSVLWWNCVNYTNHEFAAAKAKYGN